MEPTNENVKLSEGEKIVLGIIYDYIDEQGIKPNLIDVTEAVNKKTGKDLKLQTVATFISRMKKKVFLLSEKKGRIQYYQPKYSKYEMLLQELHDLSFIYFNGDSNKLKNFTNQNI